MKKIILLYCGIAFSLSACSKKISSTGAPEQNSAPKTYTITEDFESGTKTAYAAASVNLITGSWKFEDALIGNLAGDVKNGSKSVRLRAGKLSMNFDIKGVNTVYVKHAKYGSDATSEWSLWMSKDGGSTYQQIDRPVIANSTAFVIDSFKVAATGKVRFEIRNSTATRMNLDDITFKGTGDPEITVGEPDTDVADPVNSSEPGEGRGVPDGSGSDVPPATGENSNLLLGNPSNAQSNVIFADNYLIDQKYYIQSYSSTRGIPNWVSWHLDKSHIVKATDRLDNFAAFTGLPQGWYQVKSTSYSGSGFDRGHNCPSADRVSSTEANSSTFLMTNMIPQAPENNQKTWTNLENYLRNLVVAGNEIYIIMGSYGTGGTGKNGAANAINNGKVTVPSNVWKVAVIIPEGTNDLNRVTSTIRVLAVNTPNINSINPDWKQYITTIDAIETATGYDLLSALPVAVQNAIEAKKDLGN